MWENNERIVFDGVALFHYRDVPQFITVPATTQVYPFANILPLLEENSLC